MDTLPKVGFMPIRDLFNQLSKRLGGTGGTNTSGSDDGGTTDRGANDGGANDGGTSDGERGPPTTADLDAAVAKAESTDAGDATADPGGLEDPEVTGKTGTDGRRGTATSSGGTVLAEAGQPAGNLADSETPARSDADASARPDAEARDGAEVDELDSVAGTTAADVGEAGEIDAGGQTEDTGGPVQCRIDGCGQTFATAHGMKIHATKVHGEDVKPPHRDPERLREVYEAHDTFTEMTEALDVEVTPQTVRRSMASLGIHDPDDPDASTDEGSPGDGIQDEADGGDGATQSQADGGDGAESADPTAGPQDTPSSEADGPGSEADGPGSEADGPGSEADGTEPGAGTGDSDTDRKRESEGDRNVASPGPNSESGLPLEKHEQLQEALPEGIEASELIAAIEEARTLYEVQRALGTDRTETQKLLADLGLLDLVQCRLSTKPDPEERRAELERRLGDGTAT